MVPEYLRRAALKAHFAQLMENEGIPLPPRLISGIVDELMDTNNAMLNEE